MSGLDNEIDTNPIENNDIKLQYGDIIEIHASRNHLVHEQTFYITYIDEMKIKLINSSTLLPHELKLSDEGNLTDESIEEIELVSRADEKGYARQNHLLPKKWVDVHFGGDFPTIITGEITNLEEDMIEITTYPDLDVIYIDFEYKGLPEYIPIKEFVLRKKPEQLKHVDTLTALTGLEEGEVYEEKASMEMTESGESIISIPESAEADEQIRDALHSIYIDADDIVFGREIDEIAQVVEINEREKRYTIETQVNNLLDELLSTIPNSQRSQLVLDNIHRIINRFKELRLQFSNFDDNGNVHNMKIIGPDYKPLIERIQNMDRRLKWLVPVVLAKRKIFHTKNDNYSEELSDIASIYLDTDLEESSKIQNDYFENKSDGDVVKFKKMIKQIDPYMTPFEDMHSEQNLDNHLEVKVSIDAILDNLENFQSTVVKSSQFSRRRFVIQRYNLGVSSLEPEVLKNGKRIFKPKNICPNDHMNLNSIITLPQSVMQYSKIELPSTNIMKRASLGQNPFYLFRALKSKTKIDQYIVDDFAHDIDYEKIESETNMQFLSTMKEYVLDETLSDEKDKLEFFLKVIVPKTRSLIRLVRPYIQDKLSLVDIVRELEPFMVYTEDITYKQYMEIRYFIKERLKQYKAQFNQKSNEFTTIRNTKYNVIPWGSGISNVMISTTNALNGIFIDGYKFDHLNIILEKRTKFNLYPSELLSKIMTLDNGELLSKLISNHNLSLIIPDNFMDALQLPELDDMGRLEKIKATDCARRFIAKKYTMLKDLQKDNHEDIFYDEEYDDTPYEILKKYKDDQNKMLAEDFVDFLAENLVKKHECPRNLAKEMAITLITGKKMVKDGEYAIFELKPQLLPGIDESELSKKEKAEIESEGNISKIVQYYRRRNKHWSRDINVDETTFIDNNTLFCNMNKMCFKNTSNSVCDSVSDSAARMKIIAKKKMLGEADSRYTKTFGDLEKEFEHAIEDAIKKISKINVLKEIQSHRANNYAYELGNFAVTDELLQSPYLRLRDFILGQDDFIKRQYDICKLVDEFCREPMVAELNEDPYFYYCKVTNTKLLPQTIYILAKTFISGNDYQQKQDELCRSHGVLSDDGDSIVDKYSGYVIRKIDFVSDEGFDEAGFKISTNEIMEMDLKTLVEESLKNKDKVFENETSQTVYNIHSALCLNMGIPSDGMEEFVMRISIELIETNLKKEAAYAKFAEKMEKQKGKRPLPYAAYRNQTIIMIIASTLLIAIQTSTPPFKPKITTSGCVRSFSGYPMSGGDEDTSGIKYIACVVDKTKSKTTKPWDSIQGMPLVIIQKSMKDIIDTMLVNRGDIGDLYVKKREYILFHPEEMIPEEHSIAKWRGFLPPVVPFTVVKTLHTVSNEYKADFLDLMRNGNKDQREHLYVFKSKIRQFGYGIIESINAIVAKKESLLNTNSNVAFLQNACCNDKNTRKTLDYFVEEDPSIANYIKVISSLSGVVSDAKSITTASVLYHPENTSIQRPAMPTEHFDSNVYAAIIFYCRFDRDMPVPEDLKTICSERPAGYKPHWSLEEKIEFLKSHGKRYHLEHLNQLMNIVSGRNRIESTHVVNSNISTVDALNDFLEFLDTTPVTIIDARLRKHLSDVLSEYNPKQFRMEDSDAITRLKNYLTISNRNMYNGIHTVDRKNDSDGIYDFLNKYGNMNDNSLMHMDTFIQNITKWEIDREQKDSHLYYEEGMYSIVQFMKNSIYFMTKVFPEMILNNVDINNVPKHWNLASIHNIDISRNIKNYYEKLNEFKKDNVIAKLLRELQTRMINLNIMVQHIPIHTSIHKGDDSFYLLFDKQVIYSLMTYLWYSVICEVILMTNDPDLLRLDILENKASRREKIRDMGDSVEGLQTIYKAANDEEVDQIDDLQVQLEAGNQLDFKKRTASLLIAFLTIDKENKESIDLPYIKISEKMSRSKQSEKKLFTDYFKNMDPDERKVRKLEKLYKMGRWNVGMQKGLVQYDKNTYMRERGELIDRLNNTNSMDDDVDMIDRDIYQIEEDEQEAIAAEHDFEGDDIAQFGDDYLDGNFYGDDGDDDFGTD